jgi:hypothetical protein
MSDHRERACTMCGSLLHHEDICPKRAGADARGLPDGTIVTCELCPFPHPKGDDGQTCRFPKVAARG